MVARLPSHQKSAPLNTYRFNIHFFKYVIMYYS